MTLASTPPGPAQRLRGLTIVPRMLLLIVPPLLAILGLSSMVLVERHQQAEDGDRVAALSSLTMEVSGLVHELQKERDVSSVMLSSGGSQFKPETAAQRQNTTALLDPFLRADRAAVAPAGSALAAKLGTAAADLARLGAVRARIDALAAPPAESSAFFTATIRDLLDIVPEAGAVVHDQAATRTLLALFDLMQAEERAGQERALGAQGFTARQFTPALLQGFTELQAEQDSFFNIFFSYATAEQGQTLREALEDPANQAVARLRRAALKGGLDGVDGTSWFAAATTRIDLLHDVELAMARHLAALADAERAQARMWFRLLLVAVGGTTALIGLLTPLTGRSLSRPILRMTDAMTALAGGNNGITIPERDRGDEIGAMAAAVEVFRTNAIVREENEAQIAHMAHHDALTDLPNRALFADRIRQAQAQLGRRKLAVMRLELDKLRAVNDALGHAVGDDLLRAVAERLQGCMGEASTLARLDGDEFAVLQCNATQPAGSAELATRLLAAVAEPFNLDIHRIVLEAHIGIAVAPDDGHEPHQLLRNAGVALHQAKAAGRNTHRRFEPEMDTRLQARRQIEADMREALAAGQFELYYQPLVNARSGAITGFEALMRWSHPVRGRMSPADFIPVAEETGLIIAMGEWALGSACAAAASWPEQVTVAVNLSPIQFRSAQLVRRVEAALAASGLPPERLELEVTESVLLQDDDDTLTVLHRLRGMGIRISLDDFGTGYSSLSYLRSFPFDKLKIDQCFVRDLGGEGDTTAIVRAVTTLGRSLQMKVLAEGVETAEQLAVLRNEGCAEVQGYFFSPPRPAAEVPAMFNAARRSPPAAGRPGPARKQAPALTPP